jgi:hypothetical protein
MAKGFLFDEDGFERAKRFVRRSEAMPRGRAPQRRAAPRINPDTIVQVASGGCCNAMCNPWKSIHGAPLTNCSVCGLAPKTYYVDFRLSGITDCCPNLGHGYDLTNATLDGCVWVSREFACPSAVSGTARWVLTISSTHSTLVCDLGGGNRICYEKFGPWCCVSTNTMTICCGPYFCSNFPELVCVVPRTPSFPDVSHPCLEDIVVPGLLQVTIDVEHCDCPAFPMTVPIAWYGDGWVSAELATDDVTAGLQCVSPAVSPAGTSGLFVKLTCGPKDSFPDPENHIFILQIRGGSVDALAALSHPGWSASPFNLEFLPVEEGVSTMDGFASADGRLCGYPTPSAVHKIFHISVVEAPA